MILATKINTEMYCARCREDLGIVEIHCNQQEDGSALCDICMVVHESGECVGLSEDGSLFIDAGGVR